MASQKVGSYAFLVGFVLAVIIGLVNGLVAAKIIALDLGVVSMWVSVLIVVLGLIVGLLNIKDKHITDFLIATIAISTVGTITANGFMGVAAISPVGYVVGYLALAVVAFAAPAALVVGLKQVYALAKEQN